MNRKITLGGAITLAIMFSAVTFIMTMIYARNTFDSMVYNIKERETMYSKLSEVDRLIRQRYLRRIDEDKLSEELVKGYIAGIEDEYGVYMTAEQYSELQNDTQGRMVDIGVVCSTDVDGHILIEEVYPDSPAALSELVAGDLIVKVDDLAVTAESFEDAVFALKGDPGTTVTIVVRRDNVETPYTITRRRVDVPTVEGRMIGENVGYLRIEEFNDNTPDQFFKIFTELTTDGAQGFIFDVRNNPGGTVESVCRILDTLLPEGPIVSAKYRNVAEPQVLFSSDESEVNAPMTVLINGKSASAAELFAQALKDYDKARAVGTTSFGKGSMQEIHKLSDGSAIDFTVALYNPPTSRNFDGVGVKPDYEVKMSPELEKEMESLDENSDLQLKKALEVVTAALKNRANPSGDALAHSVPSVHDPSSDSTSAEGETSEGENEQNIEAETSEQEDESSDDEASSAEPGASQ